MDKSVKNAKIYSAKASNLGKANRECKHFKYHEFTIVQKFDKIKKDI